MHPEGWLTMSDQKLGMSKRLNVAYSEALPKVRAALKAQGFGVLTEVDVTATLREKLGAEFRQYTILGACNPRLAQQALGTNIEVGLLLPCNVIVYEDEDATVVSAFDPEAGMRLANDPALDSVAHEAKVLLTAALESLG